MAKIAQPYVVKLDGKRVAFGNKRQEVLERATRNLDKKLGASLDKNERPGVRLALFDPRGRRCFVTR